jgi:eukaryotic-like serine/threonine-protein kinase
MAHHMAARPGSRIGAYEILGLLGAGGMGEVYRARDTRLQRDVAVKIIPDALANDAVARGRFETEARAVASLSHPNIIAIHDFGQDGTVAYAVMELLDGRTLRDLLAAVRCRHARGSITARRSPPGWRPHTRAAWCTAT